MVNSDTAFTSKAVSLTSGTYSRNLQRLYQVRMPLFYPRRQCTMCSYTTEAADTPTGRHSLYLPAVLGQACCDGSPESIPEVLPTIGPGRSLSVSAHGSDPPKPQHHTMHAPISTIMTSHTKHGVRCTTTVLIEGPGIATPSEEPPFLNQMTITWKDLIVYQLSRRSFI